MAADRQVTNRWLAPFARPAHPLVADPEDVPKLPVGRSRM